ncbi:MAG: glycosyltransferase family 2 protein [Rikenellaceae bacterium]
MDISVIVPIYGVEKYIEKSLRSLFSQTKTEGVEFILVNDCTPDRSMEIAREVAADFHALDIKIVEHKTNQGVATARQSGLDAATGEYTTHFDPDDWCEANMLEEMYACAIDNGADVVVCDYIFTKNGVNKYEAEIVGNNGVECMRNLITNKMRGFLCPKLIKRSIIIENNITFYNGLNLCEDLLFSLSVFAKTDKIIHLQKAYLHYLYRDSSLTSVNDIKKRLPLVRVVEEIENTTSKTLQPDNFYDELTFIKIRFKQFILDVGDLTIFDQYGSIYPEIIPHIMANKNYSFIRRLGLYLESKYPKGIGRLTFITLRALRKIKKHIS